jgi:tRNA(fMet)-specific endonuclease VapC
MKRYLLDSNMLGFYTNRKSGVYERAKTETAAGADIGTCLPIMGEYLGGVANSTSAKRNLPLARRTIESMKLWPYDLAAAEEYARLYAELRRKGITIGAIDLQAAAVARTLGNCTIVTFDSDFSHVPGLAVENWME